MTLEEVTQRALQEAVPCKCCKRQPTMIHVSGGLHYAQCDCKKWVEWPYQFVGTTPKGAVSNWNMYQKKDPDSSIL